MADTPDKIRDDIVGAIRDQTSDLKRVEAPGTAVITAVASLATAQYLKAANINRKGLMIYNSDANALSIKYGPEAAASAGNRSVVIPTANMWEMPQPIYHGVISGIWAADGSGHAEITEW